MMVATNWGVYEFGKRDPKFRDVGDDRDMQIRARSVEHLAALRKVYRGLGETVFLGNGVADFQYRVFITRTQLADMMRIVVMDDIRYVQFKKDAKDQKLHSVLSEFWTTLLRAYPKGSSYSTVREERKDTRRTGRQFPWED